MVVARGDTTTIIVDKREPKNLRKRFEEKMLDVGDYIVGEFVIERKKVADFINSYLQGRLKRQLAQLCKVARRPVLVIVGDYYKHYFHTTKRAGCRVILPTTYAAMIASLSFSFPQLQIVCLPNDTTFVRFLEKLEEKQQRNERFFAEEITLLEQKIPKEEEFMTRFFMLFDGVGVEKARKLAKKFDNLQKLISANKKDLIQIEGVGPKLAEKILLALRR